MKLLRILPGFRGASVGTDHESRHFETRRLPFVNPLSVNAAGTNWNTIHPDSSKVKP